VPRETPCYPPAVTAVTPIRRPDELNDRLHAAGGNNVWPGRAVNPGDSEGPLTRAPWAPRTPTETTLYYRRP
jgi:hypothetical protein